MATLTPLGVGSVRERGAPRAPYATFPPSAHENFVALTLSGLPGVGDRSFRIAVDHFGTATAALRAPAALRALLPRASVAAPQRLKAERAARTLLDRTAEGGFELWTYGAKGYPRRLGALHDPPAALWGRGDERWLEQKPPCAVVGSRRATPSGLRIAHALGRALALARIGVASGMALGIDAAAHRGALDGGGATIAVLGSGVDVPTPRSQRALYGQILQNGLVLSEFPPGAPAAAQNFPRRNRILAALSRAVVVVEAAKRSGALITVDHALDLGVSVFAVPGSIESARNEGSNALLADGAGVIVSAAWLVEALDGGIPERPPPQGVPSPELEPAALELWELLEDGPLTVDAMVAGLKRDPAEVLAVLGALELAGWLEVEPGARYARTFGRSG